MPVLDIGYISSANEISFLFIRIQPAGIPPPLPSFEATFPIYLFFPKKFNSENNETPFCPAILLDGFRNKRRNLTGYNDPDNVI
jgi:hypothetical protein